MSDTKENKDNKSNLETMLQLAMEKPVEEVAPTFRRKTTLNDSQIEKIIQTISTTLGISNTEVLIGMTLLFLQGAASAGAPITMSVDLGGGKCIEKRNIIDACNLVTGHKFIRRIAETLAPQIGKIALQNKLTGELGYRIENKLKAETGESLTDIERAYCSSFSQAIPNLAEITSERLARLLAEDYQKRFENRKRQKQDTQQQNKNNNKKKK